MDTKQVTFIQDRVPGLRAGEYTITVSDHIGVSGQGVDDTFIMARKFQVRGERFTILDSEIHAVFPPDKSTGPYLGSVPYITFNRAMLPWLRGLYQGEAAADGWLAVLLFDPNEMPSLQTLKVRDLIPSNVTAYTQPDAGSGYGSLPSDHISYPFNASGGSITLDYGETLDDVIRAIDIPTALFQTVAPSDADMAYLAHVREVDLTGRDILKAHVAVRASDDGVELGQLATVLGNRLSAPGDAHAVLVSLEGFGPYLPGGDQAGYTGQFAAVRLVVLKEWRFTTLSNDDAVLAHALQHVCDDPTDPNGLISHLRVPASIPSAADVAAALAAEAAGQLSDAQADTMVRHGFALGYTPLSHHMRTGGRDISWYRGPLTPVAVTPTPPAPYDSSDAALAYNPETGLFDVSYAAAWQLGQMLGLANRQFASALYSWQLALLEQGEAGQDQLSQALPMLAAKAQAGGNDIASLFTRLFAAEFTGPRSRRFAQAADAGPPPIVTQYLADLKQLKSVPLNYLIPDNRMMPGESLRFFHLDTNWINALLDGACSIVRSLTGKAISETSWLYQPADGPISGYLLNSQVVIGWPGIEIVASDVKGAVLQKILEVEPASGLRMALFQGDIDLLEIQEPPEGLHFGVDYESGADLVELRQLTGKPGKILTGQAEYDRLPQAPRVNHYDHTARGWVARTDPNRPPDAITVPAVMRGPRAESSMSPPRRPASAKACSIMAPWNRAIPSLPRNTRWRW